MKKIGAHYLGKGKCEFLLWAPFTQEVTLKILSPEKKCFPLEQITKGYWQISLDNVASDATYVYQIHPSTTDRPDPASFYQPSTVHGPSQIVDHGAYRWDDESWQGIPLSQMIIYELHVGTFSLEGTFFAIINRLNDLKNLGVNVIEIMPVAQFPGDRNWGYDGVFPFAVQNSYGGPNEFKKFIDICHQNEISVILDVVYNHLGPEGNYLSEFGPYFTDKYLTPWGKAINFDGEYSDEVRNYFIQNALYWYKNYHIDGLRLDAVHGIYDKGAKHFLADLSERVVECSEKDGRKCYLFAESDLNDIRIIEKRDLGGYSLDAQWNDDYHHSLHAILVNERDGYYKDFGDIEQFIKSYKKGFVYSWEYSPYRKRLHGSSSDKILAERFIVFLQNHDQVGNRFKGERLSHLVTFESQKLAASLLMISPYIPMLFMGEEYAETSPFLYFVSHSDKDLIEAIRKGREKEFIAFQNQGEVLDPQNSKTFAESKLNWNLRHSGKHKILLQFYQYLIDLRKKNPILSQCSKKTIKCMFQLPKDIVFLHRSYDKYHIVGFINFSDTKQDISLDNLNPLPKGLIKILDSSAKKWLGPGSCDSLDLYHLKKLSINAQNLILFSNI